MKFLAALFLFPMAAFGVVVPALPFDAAVLVKGQRPGIVIGIW